MKKHLIRLGAVVLGFALVCASSLLITFCELGIFWNFFFIGIALTIASFVWNLGNSKGSQIDEEQKNDINDTYETKE